MFRPWEWIGTTSTLHSVSPRNRLSVGLLSVAALATLLAVPARPRAAGPPPGAEAPPPTNAADESAFQIPDFARVFGTWLWLRTDGIAAISTPETRGARRRLVLKPDYTYQFRHRTVERDSLLCRGLYSLSEQSGTQGRAILLIEFEGWIEPYEKSMLVDFESEGVVHLVGYPCENCPEHTFARGRAATIEGEVKRGERFQADLWEGVRFELNPTELGWGIAVRDTSRPQENLARLTPPLHGEANPRLIEGWHFRNKAGTGPNLGDGNAPGTVRDFIFSPDVGRTIQGPGSEEPPTEDEVVRVAAAGRGTLVIREMKLGEPVPGRRAWIESMRFSLDVEERTSP